MIPDTCSKGETFLNEIISSIDDIDTPLTNHKLASFSPILNRLEDEKLEDLESIIAKYLDPFKPQNTKPKSAARQRYAAKQKEKVNKEINNLLQGGAQEIIDGSVSKEEAQTKIKSFLGS